MITAAQRERAVASFLCNSAWRAVYDGALDGAKEQSSDGRYLALSMAGQGGVASRIRRHYEAKLAACKSRDGDAENSSLQT